MGRGLSVRTLSATASGSSNPSRTSASRARCGATAGQTAVGFITAPNYWALIGYWLPEGEFRVREQAQWPNQGPLVTRLYAPQPNPFARGTMIRYSLAGAGPVSVQVFDPTGRATRTLAAGVQKPGRYSLRWDGRDNAGRPLGNGAYFCRFVAGDHQQTEKLLLVR